ncbi:MAG: hypothetical protein ACREQQ_13210, partial [Candidatus Binatia bacterium]
MIRGRVAITVLIALVASSGRVSGADPLSGRAPTHPSLAAAKLPELIPIARFYADDRATWLYSISPDGKKLAWIGPWDLWTTAFFKVLGKEKVDRVRSPRRIDHLRWAEDSRTLLFFWDQDGDENYHLIASDTERPEEPPRDLTPFGDVQVRLFQTFPRDPRHILVEHNRRDRSIFDLYRLDIRTGEEALVAENPGDVFAWATDARGVVIARQRRLERGRWSLEATAGGGKWVKPLSGDEDEEITFEGHTGDPRFLLALSNHSRDRTALVRLDLTTGAQTVLYEDPHVDVTRVWIDETTHELLAAQSWPDHPKLHSFHPGLRESLSSFRDPAAIDLLSWDRARDTFTVYRATDRSGHAVHLLERRRKRVALLGRSGITEFEDLLSEQKPIRFASRDGLDIRGYLMIPKGTDGKNLPTVLRVHGG